MPRFQDSPPFGDVTVMVESGVPVGSEGEVIIAHIFDGGLADALHADLVIIAR